MRLSLRDHRVRVALIVIAVIAAYQVITRALPEIDLQELLHDVSTELGHWTYLVVGVSAFLETGAFVGLVLPGETVIILAGAVAGQDVTSLVLTIAIVWASAWAGDSTSFLIGRRLGRGFLLRNGPKLRISRERLSQVEAYFSRHGGKTILVGRFIGFVRAIAPFVAGSSGMRYRQFVPYSILGTGLWGAAFTLIGYFASQSLDQAAKLAGRGTFLFAVAIGVIVGIVAAIRFLRVPENRVRAVNAMQRRPLLRPLVALGRRVKPQAQFLWQRLTPGGLGLEFTALLAALSVALYVAIVYTVVISGDPGPTPGDHTALQIAGDIQTGWLTEICKAVTTLGAAYVAWPVAAIAAIALGARGRWPELAVLVAAMLITIVVVADLKEMVGRPRPSGGLVEVGNEAFPSAHAAYSVVYAWLAVTLAVRLRSGLSGGTALIAVGIAVTAIVGLTRVYLRVHYMSAIAVLASHLRQNARADARPGQDRA
jgi:membrane protein DedA with SNARE-associated domain